MEKKKKQGMTRRTFIKNTAAAGAGAIVFTGAGCNKTDQSTSAPEPSTSAPEPSTSAPEPSISVTEPKKYSWENPPAPIPDSKIKEKFTSDIVVVGFGISGATAALSASDENAKVIVLEKWELYNCRGSDNAAIDSSIQNKMGVKIDKDEVCLALQKYAGNRTDQRLLRLWADNSGRILDWLGNISEKHGIKLYLALKNRNWPIYPEGQDPDTEWHKEFNVTHYFTGRQPGLMWALEKEMRKRNIDIRYNTRVVQLIRKNGGRVTGVIAQDKDGNYVQYNADKGVILCTGEYGHDEEMMEKYCPWAAEIAKTTSPYIPPVNTGDGHKMAMWIGGVMEPAPHAPVDHSGGGPLGASAFLHVNTLGERYENEDITCQLLSNAMKRQPGKTLWQVYDSKWEDEVDKMGIGLLMYGDPSASPAPASEGTYPIETPPPPAGNTVKAYTIDELARKMEVPVETFKKTVERYNYLAEIGKDLDFGKRPDRMMPINKPPYYAGDAIIAFLVVLGGLYVNTRLQLLDQDRQPIEGIYLAGNTVGNRFANDYPTMCSGLTHGFAWLTGYLASKSALGVPDPAWEPKMA